MPVRLAQVILTALLLGTMLMVSACGGDASTQQQVSKDQAYFDSLLKHAQAIGVPQSLLQPLMEQEQALNQTHAPFSLFNNHNTDEYYSNVATRYQQLTIQLQGIVATSTEQAANTAEHDLQNLQTTLARCSAQGLPVQNFTRQLNQERLLLHSAQYPKDYAAISAQARTATQALNLLQQTSTNLTTLKNTISQMQNAQIDVTWLQMQYASDQQTMTTATTPADFQQLGALIDAQYLQAVIHTTQAIPYVTTAKLHDFASQIQSLKSYGGDTTAYQKELTADQARMNLPMNLQDYITFSKQIDTNMSTLHSNLLKTKASYLVNQFHQEVNNWGNAHLYHDTFNGKNYPIDAGYMSAGIGSDLDGDLSAAVTPDDFQNVVNEAQNDLFDLHMLEADYADSTPYTQPHNTDLQMLQHYNLIHGQVIVVSMAEQALRVYQDGNLVRAIQVTTGQEALPSLPGVWQVLARESPTVFKSPDPPDSPYWYPDTPIHYAILYHSGGYFIHDSWWRADYGPGTQFPHYDSGGDEAFAGTGSHGCVNVPLDQAAWLYSNTNWQTQIVIY
jgi:lipoprotein-anchoring transpeptidase ErfK/SrfK